MRKQSVEGGFWYIVRRRKRRGQQNGKFLPIGPSLGGLAGPLIGSVPQPILKKMVGGKRPKQRRQQKIIDILDIYCELV